MSWSREGDTAGSPTEVAFRTEDGRRRLWLREVADDEAGWMLESLVAGAGGALEPRCEEWVSVADALGLAPEVGEEVLLMTRACLVRLRRAGRSDDAAALARDLARAEGTTGGDGPIPAAPGASSDPGAAA